VGKIVIIFTILIISITATILVAVYDRSEVIPQMLCDNFQDIGSYALQFGINQVAKGLVTEDKVVTYTGNDVFNVLDGTINSLDYKFKITTTTAEFVEDDPNIEGEDEGAFIYVIAGTLNINPGNSSNNEFQMETPTKYIDRDEIHKNAPEFEYEGPATIVRVKPKAQGRTLNINGTDFELNTNARYTISSNNMNVKLWNDHIKKGKAMGKWWIEIDAEAATIELDPGIPLDDFVAEKSWSKEETFRHIDVTITADVSMHTNGITSTHDSIGKLVVLVAESEDKFWFWWTVDEEESSYKVVYWNP